MKKIIVGLSSLVFLITMSNSLARSAHEHKRNHTAISASAAAVNINQANVHTLASLKGIGLKRAQMIVDYRSKHGKFKSLNDLASIKGISEKSVARLEKNNPGRMVLN